MHVTRRTLLTLLVLSTLLFPVISLAKANVVTLQTGGSNPQGIAINTVTNKIYIVNSNSANVTVINGATNQNHTIPVDNNPVAIDVDEATNKIYVADHNARLVTIIDGPTENTAPITVGDYPDCIAVNPVTNKIYVGTDNGILIIDGATRQTTFLSAPRRVVAIAVNTVTNKIYGVSNDSSKVTVVDGLSGTIDATITVGTNPNMIAI